MDRNSHAIGTGIAAVRTYFDMDIVLETHDGGKHNVLGRLLDGLLESSQQLHFAPHLVDFAKRCGGATNMRAVIHALMDNEDVFEYLAGSLGLEALGRAEYGAGRLQRLLEILPLAEPRLSQTECSGRV